MEELENRKNILFAAGNALIGNVTNEMRMISLKWSHNSVDIRVIFSKEPNEDDKETVSDIMAELLAHFPKIEHCDELCIFSDLPLEQIEPFGELIFMKKE